MQETINALKERVKEHMIDWDSVCTKKKHGGLTWAHLVCRVALREQFAGDFGIDVLLHWLIRISLVCCTVSHELFCRRFAMDVSRQAPNEVSLDVSSPSA